MMLTRCCRFTAGWFPRVHGAPPVPDQVSLPDPQKVKRIIGPILLPKEVVMKTVESIGQKPCIRELPQSNEGHPTYGVGPVQVIDESSSQRDGNVEYLEGQKKRYKQLTDSYLLRQSCAWYIKAGAVTGMTLGVLPPICVLMEVSTSIDPAMVAAIEIISMTCFLMGKYYNDYNEWAFGKAPEHLKTFQRNLEVWKKHPAQETIDGRTINTPHDILRIMDKDPVGNNLFHKDEINALFVNLMEDIKNRVDCANNSLVDMIASQRVDWTAAFYSENKISKNVIDCLKQCRFKKIQLVIDYVGIFSQLHNRLKTHQAGAKTLMNRIDQEEENEINAAESNRDSALRPLQNQRDDLQNAAWVIQQGCIRKLPSPQSAAERDAYKRSIETYRMAYNAAYYAADVFYEERAAPIELRCADIIAEIQERADERRKCTHEQICQRFVESGIMEKTISSFNSFYDALVPLKLDRRHLLA